MDYQMIGEGETLVLIHGLGQTQNAWELQKELSNQFKLFIPTLRGHGDSLTTANLTLKHFAQDILHMLDVNNIRSAHFCGLSLGGVIVQEIYSQAPRRVKSMILANTTSFVPGLSFDLTISDRERTFKQLSDEQYIMKVSRNALYRPTDNELQQAINTFKINRTAYIPASRAIRGINYLPLLNTHTPIHIITSSNDNVTPHIYNAQLTKLWSPGAKLSVIKDAGHLSNIQKPKVFNKIVSDFVENYNEKRNY